MNQSSPAKLALPKYFIRVEAGPHAGEFFYPEKAAFNIGRGAENEVVLANDPKISRQHAKIFYSQGQFQIENISGKNSILIDNQLVQNSKLKSGSVIVIGDSEFVIEYQQAKPSVPTVSPRVQNRIQPAQQVSPQINRVPGPSRPQIPQAPPRFGGQLPRQNPNAQQSNSLLIFVAVLGLLAIFFFFKAEDKKSPPKKLNIKNKTLIEKELEASKKSVEEYLKQKKISTDGETDAITQSAEAYFVKGFRDFRQGQYARAISSLQACLSFNPDHALAKKYLMSAIRKQDETNQVLMIQGKRYRANSNFRMCMSAFRQVMINRNNKDDSLFKEAKTYYDECDYLSRGRF